MASNEILLKIQQNSKLTADKAISKRDSNAEKIQKNEAKLLKLQKQKAALESDDTDGRKRKAEEIAQKRTQLAEDKFVQKSLNKRVAADIAANKKIEASRKQAVNVLEDAGINPNSAEGKKFIAENIKTNGAAAKQKKKEFALNQANNKELSKSAALTRKNMIGFGMNPDGKEALSMQKKITQEVQKQNPNLKGAALDDAVVKRQAAITSQMREQNLLGRHHEGNTTRIAMNYLSIMFMGQAINKLFKGILASGMNAFKELTAGTKGANGALTMLEANIKFIQFSLGAAISDALIPYMDEIAKFAEWVSDIFMQHPEMTMLVIFGGIAVGTIASIVGQVRLLAASISNIVTNQTVTKVMSDFFKSFKSDGVTNIEKVKTALDGIGRIAGIGLNLWIGVTAGIKSVEEFKKGSIATGIGYGIATALSAAGMWAAFTPGGGIISLALFAAAAVTTGITDIIVSEKESDKYYSDLANILGLDNKDAIMTELKKRGYDSKVQTSFEIELRQKHNKASTDTSSLGLTQDQRDSIWTEKAQFYIRKIIDEESSQKDAVDKLIESYLELSKAKDIVDGKIPTNEIERKQITDEAARLTREMNNLALKGTGYFGDLWSTQLSSAIASTNALKNYQDEFKATAAAAKEDMQLKTGYIDSIQTYNAPSVLETTAQQNVQQIVTMKQISGETVSTKDIADIAKIQQAALNVSFDISAPMKKAFTDVQNNQEVLAEANNTGMSFMSSFNTGFSDASLDFRTTVSDLSDNVLTESFGGALDVTNEALDVQGTKLKSRIDDMKEYANATNSAANAQERLNKAARDKKGLVEQLVDFF